MYIEQCMYYKDDQKQVLWDVTEGGYISLDQVYKNSE